MKNTFSSIREKLQGIVVFATVAALVCATLGNIVGNVVSYHYRHVSDVSTSAELLGRMTTPALQFDDPRLASDNLALLAARPNVRSAAIYTGDNRLFATYAAKGQQASFPAKIERDRARIEGTALVVTRQIVNDGNVLGAVYLRVGYGLGAIIARAIGLAALVGLFATGIALILIRRMEKLVTAPIAAVASIAREVVEQQDYSRRVAKTTDDEVGELVDSFNDMLAEVERRTAALQASYRDVRREAEERELAQQEVMRLNSSLEHRVQERTSDLQQANRELTAAKAAADQANGAKSSFLATMSHEIRTPMNGVIGMIDVLQQTNLKGHQIEMLDLIRESAFSLLAVIEDILDFSKIESGRLELEQAPFSLREMAENACGMLANLALKKAVYLTVFVEPAIPATVIGDALRLRQVLVNLVSNAIKFSSGREQPGRVTVRVRLASHATDTHVAVDLDVIDNGIGIDESTRARLFTAFSQADTSTTRRFGGTGLGLAISRRLVDLMGGTLELQSEPGRGSTFSVHLALLLAQREAITRPQELAGLRCMVIGGAAELATDLVAYLADEGAQTQQAVDVAQACSLMGALGPGQWIGVIDTTDPASDDESLRELKRRGPEYDVRIVAIGRSLRSKSRARDAGVVFLDANVLTRRRLCRAVNLAAGRAPAPTPAGRPPGELKVPSREEARRAGRLILVAEDDATNQKVILRQLALLGFAAEVAADGRQALELWRSGDYGLVLTDLHMPSMDGYELTAAIRAQEQGRRHVPIAALTATALKGESERCLAVGMDQYLTKPLQLSDLRKALDELFLPLPRPVEPPQDAALDGSTAAAVDVGVLEDLVGNDPAVILDLLQSFQDSAGRSAELLKAACSVGDMAATIEQAHRLKSSARTVGAMVLGALCEEIETAGKAGAGDTLAQLLPVFEREADAVNAFLVAFRQSSLHAATGG